MTILLPGHVEPDPSDEFPIYARSGWQIPQEKPEPVEERLIRIRAEELMHWLPDIRLRSLSNYPYNCVGMIFAARRAWIEIDHIYKILAEDGYRQILRGDVTPGDVVLYKANGDLRHVALVVDTLLMGQTLDIRVISKWGQDAEFIHTVDQVAFQLGKPVEFYTDRIVR